MYIKYEEKRVNPPQRSRIDLEGGWVKVEVRLHYILCAATRRVMFLPPSLRLTFLIELRTPTSNIRRDGCFTLGIHLLVSDFMLALGCA